jgi:hypothetical protein
MNATHCFPLLFSVKPDLILLQAGFIITLIPPAVRPDYLETLEKAHTSDGDFVKLMHGTGDTKGFPEAVFCVNYIFKGIFNKC